MTPQTQQFLDALFPSWPPGALAEIRAFENGQLKAREWVGSVDGLIKTASRLADKTDVFYGVCLRRGRKGKKADVVYVAAFWVDMDKPPEEAQRILNEFPLPPSAIIFSGHGLHAYWLLREPYFLEEPDDIAEFEARNRGLAHRLGADDAWDLSRVLRVPGTVNHKNGGKESVVIHELYPDRRYNLPDFDEWASAPEPAEDVDFNEAEATGAIWKAAAGGVSATIQRLITEGSKGDRSKDDYAVCCALVRAGLTDGGIKAIFATYPIGDKYRERGNGDRYLRLTLGKAKAEVQEICGSYPTPRTGNRTERFSRTDAGNGELFAQLHGDRLRYDHRRKLWLLWANHWWLPDADAEVQRLAKQTTRYRYQAATSIADLKEREAEAKWAIGSESRTRLDAALYLAQAEHPIADAGNRWDSDPYLMGVANGVLDLRSGQLRAGSADDYISMRSPVSYDPSAQCPRWQAFLNRVMGGNADLIAFLKRVVGYSLTGDVTEQAIFFAYGTGANGKSTFLSAILDALGDYGCQAAPGLLVKKRGDSHPTELADLVGRRFVASVEVDEGRRLAEALVKWLAGGDRMKARRMRQDFFEFKPTYKIFLAANHKPTITGTDLAIWRRIKLIPFTVIIPPEEQDKELSAKLSQELPGILNWAVEGCLDWQRHGLNPPAEVEAATEAYRAEQDVLAAFIGEYCRTGPDEKVSPNALYVAYTNWCKESGEKPRSKTAFGSRLGERGFTPNRTHEGRWWRGIGLTPGQEQ